MPAGIVVIAIKDGGGTSRNFQFYSDDGTITGNLSPVPATISNVNANGRAADAASTPVALSNEDVALITAMSAKLPAALGLTTPALSLSVVPAVLTPFAVAASQTSHVLGATGAVGDYLSHLIIQPTTTAAGTFTLFDNATAYFIYTAGTLADLRPIIVPINAKSASGAWKVTTGANETVTAFGVFT